MNLAYPAAMAKMHKGVRPIIGKIIQGAALVPSSARTTGSSRRLSTTGRDADIAETHARLDRIANDLAVLKRDVVDLKSRSRRPRRKGRLDGKQLEFDFAASAEQDSTPGATQ